MVSEIKLSRCANQVLALLPSPQDGEGLGVRGGDGEFMIRQATLAEQLGCSRWTIGRAIKKLIEAGYLKDTGKRGDRRCKIYSCLAPSRGLSQEEAPLPRVPFGSLCSPNSTLGCGNAAHSVDGNPELPSGLEGLKLPQHGPTRPEGPMLGHVGGDLQLQRYRYTFQSVFNDWPDWEKHYPAVTYKLKHLTSPDDLFRQTFDALYAIRDALALEIRQYL